MSTERRSLGGGLKSLIDITERATAGLDARILPIHLILPNPHQPRTHFDNESLEELAESIMAHGILQPLVVRPDPETGDRFRIVAGERRWRAAQIARIDTLPVIVRTMADQEAMESALIENIQRDSLNPIEEATAYRNLQEQSALTQAEIAERVGKSRAHVANTVRLLNLPGTILDLIQNGRLSAGHARTLIGRENALELARRAMKEDLSVRQLEKLAAGDKKPPRKSTGIETVSADTRLLQANLSANLLTTVKIKEARTPGSGRIVISYRTLDEFDRLCEHLLKP
ncbi:MAG: ParB/RepB/Spo0J family partition protein [Rhodobacteraceae bacterium]|nr:ParB/RepB/Spo0J family partition protein [Paracoccaceae bacterium]